jgi:hypothetical protein
MLQRHTDWEAAAGLLKGIYETLARYPYIVHMQHLKTLINTCQVILQGCMFLSVLPEIFSCILLIINLYRSPLKFWAAKLTASL